MKMTSACGCGATSCCGASCCDGNDPRVPEAIDNGPGQSSLRYRVGTYASFFESMLAWLVTPPERAVACDASPSEEPDPLGEGEQAQIDWPLRKLSTRDLDDPTIALLDAWAIVGDVLTFYQERIINEGFLRTATEQRSVEEIAKLVGYRPRPGVAASVDLAFTLDRDVVTDIPAGTRAQSLPAAGKLPQSFETSGRLKATASWNALRPLQAKFRTPRVTPSGRLELFLAGISTNLRINDVILRIKPDVEPMLDAKEIFRVDKIEVLAELSTTRVLLRRYTNGPIEQDDEGEVQDEFTQNFDEEIAKIVKSFVAVDAGDRLRTDREILDFVHDDRALRESFRRAVHDLGVKRQSRTRIYVFRASSPLFGHNATAKQFTGTTTVDWPLPAAPGEERNDRLFLDTVNDRVQPGGFIVIDPATPIAAPDDDDDEEEEIPTVDELGDAFAALSEIDVTLSNAVKQYLIDMLDDPEPVERFWLVQLVDASEGLDEEDDELLSATAVSKFALGRLLELEDSPSVGLGIQLVQEARDIAEENEDIAELLDSLDAAAEKAGQSKKNAKKDDDQGAIAQPGETVSLAVYEIKTVSTHSRDAYGIVKQTLDLTLEQQWIAWPATNNAFLDPLRSVVTHNESELLRLARTPLEELEGDEIDLEGLVFDLEPGRLLIIEGEDADVPGSVRTERAIIGSVVHDLIDVSTHITILRPLVHTYRRRNTVIYGNVARATQGETRNEVLGSGDASKPSQRFALRHQPLTHVPADTPEGAASTLTVRVGGFAWPEAEHRALLGPRDRKIVTQTDEQGRTTVLGGDGWRGARFPTGIENIAAEYRSGQGADGNVEPHKITNLATRPFGVQKVTNPIGASGGAGPDDIEATRSRVPLAVKALDRLVSAADYQDFALRFAGIAKARSRLVDYQQARYLLAERTKQDVDDIPKDTFARWRVWTVVAGVEPQPLDPDSELVARLRQALRRFGDPSLEVVVVPAMIETLSITARIAIAPGWAFEEVAARVRATLLDRLGYARQGIGQAIHPSRIAALVQGIAGVEFVDLDELEALGVTDDEPLIYELGEAILPNPDTILCVDPTRPETLALEEWTP
jgi:hypothetical protein